MDTIWDKSFHPIYKCTYWTFMPPFASTKSKLGYLTTFILLTNDIRTFIFLILSEKETIVESAYVFSAFTQLTLRSIICLWNKEIIVKCFLDMNEFLKKSKSDPINQENLFLNIWKTSKVFIFAKFIAKSTMTILFIFMILAYYRVFIHQEKITYPIITYYSPYFSYNLYTKGVYTLIDTFTSVCCTYHLIYNEILLITFLHFLHSQFLYLKSCLDEIFDESNESKVNDGIIRWWIQKHCSVIR